MIGLPLKPVPGLGAARWGSPATILLAELALFECGAGRVLGDFFGGDIIAHAID
jgi:hypothetical protein